MWSNSVSEEDMTMAKAKAKTSKDQKYVSCAGSKRSMTASESGMSTNKRWTVEPGPAGVMIDAKASNAKASKPLGAK